MKISRLEEMASVTFPMRVESHEELTPSEADGCVILDGKLEAYCRLERRGDSPSSSIETSVSISWRNTTFLEGLVASPIELSRSSMSWSSSQPEICN